MKQNYSEAGYGKYEVAFGDSPAVVVWIFRMPLQIPNILRAEVNCCMRQPSGRNGCWLRQDR